MTEIVDLFKDALASKNKLLIETLISLFPALSYEPQAEDYLISVAKAYDLKHFGALFKHGKWHLDADDLPQAWSFLIYPKHKFAFSRVKQGCDHPITEEQASQLVLNQEVKDWFIRALHLITGHEPKFCEQTLKYTAQKERVKAPHLRFLFDETLSLSQTKAKLNVLGVPFYAGMIRYNQHVLTIPILGFKKLYEIMQLPLGKPPRLDLTQVNASKVEGQYYLATLFDICFQLEALRTQMTLRSSIYQNTFDEADYSDEVEDKPLAHCENWIDNVITTYGDWIRKHALHLVPYGLFYKSFEKNAKELEQIGQILKLPVLKEDSDLSKLSTQEKANLMLLCMDTKGFRNRIKGTLKNEKGLDDFIQYTQESLSQFLPGYIQNIKEITPWQKPYSPSYSLSLTASSQEGEALENNGRELKKSAQEKYSL